MEISKVNYRAIFENTGAATIVIGQDSFILFVNKKFEKLSCYRRIEIEGKKKWTEFVIEEDLPRVEQCTWQQEPAPDEIKDECEFRFVDRLGNIRYILAAITEIPSTHKAVMSLLDITERKLAEEALKQRDLELEIKSQSLEEANIALKVLLKHKEEDRSALEEQMLTNLKKLIVPSIENLKRLTMNNDQIMLLKLIEKHLQDIASPFMRNLSTAFRDLTPREMQVATLIREGITTREIAKSLGIAELSVNFHRRNLRLKFGIVNNAINLRSYLSSLSS